MTPEKILKSVFGYEKFRPLQKEIIDNVLNKKDTLAIMPTGGGKSLCYQIPAMIFEGITIVVSPLISLMQDQVDSLRENGVPAVYLNSSVNWDNYLEIVRDLKSGNIKIVYVSPEGLNTSRMQNLFHDCSVPIKCITIDEAHCVSEWGHDFRPDYLEIASFRKQFPNAVCLALTATATHQVQSDIIQNLHMKNPEVKTASFNRENIFLEVKPKKNALNQVLECLKEHQKECGIIYCFSRKQVDSLFDSLKGLGYSVSKYHAGLSDFDRKKNQDEFLKDEIQIMIATVAFGMGINKSNVRFVINYDMPKSLEEYYQEIGRAGRDGLASHALLLYSTQDIHKIRYFFEESSDPQKSEKLLQGIINYASAKTCRRKVLLNYFGEKFENPAEKECCCDICLQGPLPLKDLTIPTQKFMSCIIRTNARFGINYIVDILLGSKAKRIIENHHDKLSTWGIGKELSKENWLNLGDYLIEDNYIVKTGDYNILQITQKGKNALVNRDKILLPVNFSVERIINQKPQKQISKATQKTRNFIQNLSDSDLLLYNALKDWRKKSADEQNIPPYIIFGDKTIEDLVEKKPKTNLELLDVFGIGELKAEKIGSQILRIISDHLN